MLAFVFAGSGGIVYWQASQSTTQATNQANQLIKQAQSQIASAQASIASSANPSTPAPTSGGAISMPPVTSAAHKPSMSARPQ